MPCQKKQLFAGQKSGYLHSGLGVLCSAVLLIDICDMFELYQKYFKYQCTRHPDLLHEDEVGKVVYELVSIDQAFSNSRSVNVEKGYIFLLLEPTWVLAGTEGDQPRQVIQGGFLIAKYYGLRDEGSPAYIEAIQDTERISKEFALRMVADSRDGHPLFDYSANHIDYLNWTAQPMDNVGDGSYAGQLCTFEFSRGVTVCIGETAPEWQSPTPHEL